MVYLFFSTLSLSLSYPFFILYLSLLFLSPYFTLSSPERLCTTSQWISNHLTSSRYKKITLRASCPVHTPCTRTKSKILPMGASCTHQWVHIIQSWPPGNLRVGYHFLYAIYLAPCRSDGLHRLFFNCIPTGHLETDISQALHYHRSLSMMQPGQQFAPGVYNASPPHGAMSLSGSPPPPSPSIYDPISPPISGSDTSADGIYHPSRNSSATGSPSSSRANSLVHRNPLRYNPTPSPTSSSAGRRSRGRSLSDDDDHMGNVANAENYANTRKEATRRQRIEAEQRRRDELRDGYARLKDVLPVSNQKSSKVALLERGK